MRESEIATLPYHSEAQLIGVHPNRVVRGIARVGMGFLRCLHVGADSSVPKKLGRCAQYGLDQRLRVEGSRVVGNAQHRLGLGREVHLLGAPWNDHPTLAHATPIIVLPARGPQTKYPLSLAEGDLRIRRRIDEDMSVVESRDEFDLPREKHPVSENVTAHVPDAHHREGFGLNVLALLPEVALDALPRAARGDPDRLVVVALRPSRRERVSQPEAVFIRHRVGHVGVPRRSLVRSHHQVRIGRVPADHVLRCHRGAVAGEVIGEIEQTPYQGLVLLASLFHHRILVVQRSEGNEPSLGSGGDDDRILDHLSVHQPEDLGAEVVPPLTVADSSARYCRAPQMDPLHPRGSHPHLVEQLRRCDVLEPSYRDLER